LDNSFAGPLPTGPVLLTGATGFIGAAVLRRLRALGVEVRCLVRDAGRAARAGIPAEVQRLGDLADPVAVRAAAAGVASVLHLAGATKSLDDAGFERANADGVRALAEVTPDRARFVLVSSLAAVGPSRDGAATVRPSSEASPVSRYGASKLRGEHKLLEHRDRLDWCILRPPIVYGPNDDGTLLLIRQALGWLAPVPTPPRPLSLIHVEDLASALVLALGRRGVHGYFPTDGAERSDTTALVRTIARLAGRRARPVPLPMLFARAAGHVADVFHRWRGKPSFFCADKMREASAPGWVADREAIFAALGFTPTIDLAAGFGPLLERRIAAPRGAASAQAADAPAGRSA
jgi:nucleoside-diphosphate-sugar epimerase